jgi:spore coat polysaccharide biosynthesis protein SpsF
MNIIAIIQAKMNSVRLPGKVMMNVGQFTMIDWVVRRTNLASNITKLVVATTKNKFDDPIVSWCIRHGYDYFRGSEKDVLSRFYSCAKHFKADLIVRVTADDPLKDPQVIDCAINKILETNADYCSNTIFTTYPEGLDIEVFTFNALKKANNNAKLLSEREHVTPYIWKNPNMFNISQIKNNRDLSKWSITVDTKKDMEFVRRLVDKLDNNINVSLEEIINLIDKNLQLKKECNNKGQRNIGYCLSIKNDKIYNE